MAAADDATAGIEEVAAMTLENSRTIISNLLAQEGHFLDRREWRTWLALYSQQACYWVPAWRDENRQTSDPDTEISLIYHETRDGLEDRVVRLESQQSLTSMPLPRTAHFISNVIVRAADETYMTAEASWMVQIYQPRTHRQAMNFGLCEVTCARFGDEWKFARKRVQLQNDFSGAVLDFYLL
jgi:benzoate/toluate 1,2-dioxygenase beta subunit/2,4,5-trichlorophenoxyacetic acid oxygenase 2